MKLAKAPLSQADRALEAAIHNTGAISAIFFRRALAVSFQINEHASCVI